MKLLALALLTAGLALAQAPADSPDWRVADTTHRLSEFPKIHPDGSVWFRYEAPQSKKVQLRIGSANKTYDMTKDADGFWEVRIPYPGPGPQLYWFIDDGVLTPDPGSDHFYTNGFRTLVEVPSPNEDFYHAKNVPHGDVRIHWFHSTATGTLRRMFIYTPPGYDKNPDVRYPVLYLQHGAGENEAEWVHCGLANFILDNMIAEGRAKPMIVVMNNGFAARPGGATDRAGRTAAFEDMLINDVIPDVDANFRTIANRENRAMAGLSMGGGQTYQIGLAHLDVFSGLGMFSAPPRTGGDQLLTGPLADSASFNKQVPVFFFGAGTTETQFVERAREVVAQLKDAGFHPILFESEGTAHEFQTWRRCLNQFAPLLFKD